MRINIFSLLSKARLNTKCNSLEYRDKLYKLDHKSYKTKRKDKCLMCINSSMSSYLNCNKVESSFEWSRMNNKHCCIDEPFKYKCSRYPSTNKWYKFQDRHRIYIGWHSSTDQVDSLLSICLWRWLQTSVCNKENQHIS
jgi:hypothetical protein